MHALGDEAVDIAREKLSYYLSIAHVDVFQVPLGVAADLRSCGALLVHEVAYGVQYPSEDRPREREGLT